MTQMTREEAITLAIDAIKHDPRRWPYDHHQRRAEWAIRELRAMLRDEEQP